MEPTDPVSCYFEDETVNRNENIGSPTSLPTQQIETSESNPQTIKNSQDVDIIKSFKEMFPDRETHLKTLFQIYKAIAIDDKKQMWEMNEEDLLNELAKKESFQLKNDLDQQSDDIKKYVFKNVVFHKKVSSVPVFIDFAYMYYITYFDHNAPICRLPKNMLKYKLFAQMLNIPKDNLYNCFEQCIENEFFKELRIEEPPFYLRTELTEDEIKKKFRNLVLPLLKEILGYLVRLGKPKPSTQVISINNSDTKPLQRDDNLEIEMEQKIEV